MPPSSPLTQTTRAIKTLLRSKPTLWIVVVWVLGLVFTAYLTLTLHQYQQERLKTRFNTEIQRISDDVERRFQTPVYGLMGGRGVYAASESVNRREFQHYVESRNLGTEFPGVRGIGFIERVQRSELDAFVLREQADGMPDFAVRSLGGSEPDLYVIKYIEPLAQNRAALGLDIGSEPVRREGAERAARNGKAALSGAITLVQDEQSRPGFLIYVPVYRPGLPLNTPEERLAALHGLTYSPIVLEVLLQPSIDSLEASGLTIQISDKPLSEGASSLFQVGSMPAKPMLSAEVPLSVNDNYLFIRAQSTPDFEATANHQLVYTLGFAGALLSTLLAWVLWLQASGRARAEAYAQHMTLDLKKLSVVAERTTNAVVLTDANGLTEWVNEGFTRITGYSLQEVVGQKPGVLLQCPETDPKTVSLIRQALAQRQGCQVEILNRGKGGRLYWLELEIAPQFDDTGQHTGFMAIQSDITERKETLDGLNRVWKENESLMNAIKQGAIYSVADLQGNIIDLNDEFERISGYRREELMGRNHRLLKSGLQSAEFWDTAWATISGGEVWHGVVCNRSKSGEHYWVNSTIVPFVGVDGLVEKYISIRTDITAQKHAQAEIDSQRNRLDNILKGTHAGTWEWHVPSGRTVFNARWAEILGYTLQELEPTTIDTWTRLAHPDDLNASGNALQQHLSGESDFYEAEARMRHRDGHWVWVQDRGQLASREPDGSPGWMYGTHLDITERKEAENKLRESEVRFKELLAIASDWYWETDDQFRFTNFVATSSEDHQALIHPLLGKLRWEIPGITPMTSDWATHIASLERREDFHNFEYRREVSHDDIRYFSISGYPIFNAVGNFTGYRGTARDATAQKQLEVELEAAKTQAEQASLFKSQFLANMSHEIRTPMNAILGMLKLMHNTPLQPRQLDYVGKTEVAAKSLLGLLNDILDFSKVEAGKMTLDPEPFALDKLFRDLSVIFSASVGNKPVEVLFDIDPRVPRQLLGDSLRLQQILINLGGNAIKFTAKGEVVLRVRLEGLEGDAPNQVAHVRFAMKDSGIGIAPENQHKIFAGFTQAEASTTRRFGGTGLGLAICRRLVEMMGGELRLESAVGHGSTFSFSVMLPVLEPVASTTAAQDNAEAALAPWHTSGLPVLVVDDNPIARELMASMGESLGWQVETADSGEAALERVAERSARGESYRLIFIDWLMPGLDGWQTSARMRALMHSGGASDGSPAPVIMMVTANGREMLEQQTAEVQGLIDGYLVKPVTASMLFDAMQEATQTGVTSASAQTASPVKRPLAGLRLLLVEDNAINQQVAEELLSGQGAAVDIADNGLRGVEAVQASLAAGKPYAVVLMDMQMPVMDGLEATREIRSRFATVDLPIIAMTANAMASDREACLAAGMNDHIGKPFDLDRLVAKLLQWTQGFAVAETALVPEPALPTGATPAQGVVTAASGSPLLLNRAVALQRVGGSTKLLDRLSTQFLADLPSLVQACEAAEQSEPQDAAQRGLHSLKGVAATLGADALAEAAREAEQRSKAGEVVNLAHLRDVAAQTRQALRDIGIVEAPAPVSTDVTGVVQLAPSAEQREILGRLLPLLIGSDMAAFGVMGELLANSEGNTNRWAELDGQVQAMAFNQAADWVRQLLDLG